VAEGGGLLNRYRVVKPYRGFESLRLRQPSPSLQGQWLRLSYASKPIAALGEGCPPKPQAKEGYRHSRHVLRYLPQGEKKPDERYVGFTADLKARL
jgi:hypothetical protein